MLTIYYFIISSPASGSFNASCLKKCGIELAKSVAGAVSSLDFDKDDDIEVVMAGSVYVWAESPILSMTFMEEVQEHLNNKATFKLLSAPPVCGAVIWVLEASGACYNDSMEAKIIEIFKKEEV